MKYLLLIPLAGLVFLAACGGGGGATGSAALPGQSAADANATLAAVNLVYQATADAHARETAVAAQATGTAAQVTAEAQVASERATADYVAMVQATAAVATADAQATSDALVVESTRIAQAIIVSEATRVAAVAEAAAAQEATRAALVDADTAARMEQQRRREEARLRFQPVLYGLAAVALGALALAGGGFVAFLIWRAVHVQRRPVVPVGDGYAIQQARGFMAPPQLMVVTRPALPAARPLLAAGTPVPLPDAAPVVLPPARNGHVLIAGETGSGKSRAMRAVLAHRPNVVVLDPHFAPEEGWGAARVVGAGRDFDAIHAYMEEMSALLSARYRERDGGRMDFPPLTVAVDEMPAIVAAVGREIEAVWREWLREGRKVGLFLVLSTQSTRVKTLGIQGEGDLLENFTFALVLGDVARQEYGALVDGMEYPAVLRTRGKARPVLIPSVAASAPARIVPAGDLDDNGQEDAIILPPSSTLAYAAADWPRREEAPIDLDHIDARARQRIIDAYRRTLVLGRVQLELFPNYADSGGRAFYVIKDVLAEAGMIETGPDGRASPTALARGY